MPTIRWFDLLVVRNSVMEIQFVRDDDPRALFAQFDGFLNFAPVARVGPALVSLGADNYVMNFL